MTSEAERQIYGLHRGAQDRYTYFLLAAAGACIAFAVTQTKTDTLALPHALVGAAMLMWAFSFLSGCRYLAYIDSVLHGNMELIRVQQGLSPEVGDSPLRIAQGSEILKGILADNGVKAQRWLRWQFRGLASGAIAYIAWHFTEMYLRGG